MALYQVGTILLVWLLPHRPSIKSNGSDFYPLLVLTDSLFARSEIMPKSAGGKMPLMRWLCFAEALDGTAGSAAISHQLIV